MEALFRIRGGTPLRGDVYINGAKNAALVIMAAAILAEEPVLLEGVPALGDVSTLSALLASLGLTVERLEDGRLRLQTTDRQPVEASPQWVRRMRASFCVLGPLLARRGRAVVSLPGGCRIGDRPIERHLAGLAALGAEISLRQGFVHARATRLRGARVQLAGKAGPSVTGTANVLSAAVLARGETTILGAAAEPEIVDLGRFLIRLGARIDGLGTGTLRIEGVAELGGTVHRVIPDRIEAATLLLAGAITRGTVRVEGMVPGHLDALFAVLRQSGCHLAIGGDWAAVDAPSRPLPVELCAAPYPAFPTDMQPPFTALTTVAAGTSRIGDAVFPDRFLHLAPLGRFGAEIDRQGSRAVVRGVPRLRGTEVRATDLRSAAALVLAALAAEGESVIRGLGHLHRGYADLAGQLRRLGADLHTDGQPVDRQAPAA